MNILWSFFKGVMLTDGKITVEGKEGTYDARSGECTVTGGGVVTRDENLDLLRQNGRIVYIKRSLEKLSSDGRPISAANRIEDLFDQRKDAYESWSDFEIENTGIEETAANIAKMLGYGR